jgi:Uma2 family endonuclease
MTAMHVVATMTADEYLALPEGHYPRGTQLIDGEVVMTEPLTRHQLIQGDLHGVLWQWMRAEPGRGRIMLPLDVRLDDANVYAPDLLWYADGRAPRRDSGRPSPIPDLVVEVRSPSTWRKDRKIKQPVYERQGVPELWLVDTAAEVVLVLRRSAPGEPRFDVTLELGAEERLESPLLPGFSLHVAELFAD